MQLPGWATREGLPPLGGHERLAHAILETAVRKAPHPDDIASILAHCADIERSAWLWELIERWNFRGASEDAMQRIFAWLADDRDVTRLGELLRQQRTWADHTWARVAPRRRALGLLRAVDTPLARLELLRFSAHTRSDDLYKASRDLILAICAEIGMSAEEFDDSAAPALGFRGGQRGYTLGNRNLLLVARSVHEIHFVDLATQLTSTGLPSRRGADDAPTAQARAEWPALRGTLQEVLIRGSRRLARAMVRGRHWTADAWRSTWLDHGLMAQMTRQVVWIGDVSGQSVPFLPTDDGEFLTAELQPAQLTGLAGVRVAHPTELDVPAWTEALTSLEIVQPIEQVSRGSGREVGFEELMRATLDPTTLVSAEDWGWDRRARAVGPVRDLLELRVGETRTTVRIEPGLSTSRHGRVRGRQPLQRVVEVRVGEPEAPDALPREAWPARERFEISLLLSRARHA